jgi:hypothetical protein
VAKKKYDGVVHAVHYSPDGRVAWVRAYLRRGPTFSDRLLLDRQLLVDHLRAGKRIYVGHRVPLMAGTFEVTEPLRLIEKDGKEILVTGKSEANQDCLTGVPTI